MWDEAACSGVATDYWRHLDVDVGLSKLVGIPRTISRATERLDFRHVMVEAPGPRG